MFTVVMLIISNLFMTAAWYGHLKYKDSPLWIVILVSWGIALVEYCFQVPANRYGHGTFTAAQLKVLQEVITLVVFVGFSLAFLRETPRWNELLGMGLIVLAVVCVFALPGDRTAPGNPLASEADSAYKRLDEGSSAG